VEAVQRLMTALASGDLAAVVAALDPDARVIGDAGGTTRTAINVVVGADRFARFFLGLMQRYGAEAFLAGTPALVNGELGFVSAGSPGDGTRRAFAGRVVGCTVRDGRVWAAYDMANPDKLRGVRLDG
ncbi:MAG: nuclear transport factor 2 family protein, partial [Rhodococcus sp. (in: high G+C Gram-positive bacteria)]|nr:nuclear transport factor 2 family protein [Rhodococcus sp. (in: high G+C Gram-positive bacteria)]MDX5452157.1 nuclear transport factor 2 family protein [Rhodococcus sp. (in: high G+C Gram-positive bacteria)]